MADIIPTFLLNAVVFKLTSGGKVALSAGQELLEFRQPSIALAASLLRDTLIAACRLFSFIYMLRFNIQFFGLNPYTGGILEVLYRSTNSFSRLFLGFLPMFYGIDVGLIVGFILLDRIESFLKLVVIYDIFGYRY